MRVAQTPLQTEVRKRCEKAAIQRVIGTKYPGWSSRKCYFLAPFTRRILKDVHFNIYFRSLIVFFSNWYSCKFIFCYFISHMHRAILLILFVLYLLILHVVSPWDYCMHPTHAIHVRIKWVRHAVDSRRSDLTWDPRDSTLMYLIVLQNVIKLKKKKLENIISMYHRKFLGGAQHRIRVSPDTQLLILGRVHNFFFFLYNNIIWQYYTQYIF